ncbi:MAG: hypothetical protein J0M02_00525 [Planctomycetes bacterium]|nr:hypothetical protein [Planctomycetota bacterium]
MRMLLLLLTCMVSHAADAPYKDYITYPDSLSAIIRQMDRDLGDASQLAVDATWAQVAQPVGQQAFQEFVVYVARRYAFCRDRPGYIRGLMANAASVKDTVWIDDDPKCLLYAYASVKSKRPVQGVSFDAEKPYVYDIPKAAPVRVQQLDTGR